MCLLDRLALVQFDVVGNVAYSNSEENAGITGMFVHLRHLATCG